MVWYISVIKPVGYYMLLNMVTIATALSVIKNNNNKE